MTDLNHRHCLEWSKLPETRTPTGIVKRVIEGAGASLVTVHVPAGMASDRHSHTHEQFVQVAAGSGSLETEQGTTPFAAGSVFHFPAHAWHKATFSSDTVLIETNLRA